ncbi:MAG: hypothetical protein AABX89_08550 [Candidatus Thermoplasmatota archaeon]
MRFAPVLFVALLAGCTAPSAAPDAQQAATDPTWDPLTLGTNDVAEATYDFGLLLVTDPALFPYQYPIQMTGNIRSPATGDGPFPLVLLMHGRHGTCELAGLAEGIGTHLCPDAPPIIEPVNSFEGYDGLARNLASHGYVVASLNANQINDRDLVGDSGANARAELLLATVANFVNVNSNGGSGLDALRGRIDLDRVGFMGHSRGGEGVARAVTLNQERGSPVALNAIFALAPTDFARWPIPDVAFATLLPYCDGDVSNLQGAWLYDDARTLPGGPRHQILAMGANHNFYNTVWTGDDWGTTGAWCGSAEAGNGRDKPEAQRAHGDGLMASFFRFYVGGEEGFAPLWERGDLPESLCPGRDGCDGRILLSSQQLGSRRVDVDGKPTRVDGLTAKRCAPATCPGNVTIGTAAQTTLSGTGVASYDLGDAAGFRDATVRLGVPTSTYARGFLDVGCDGHRLVQPFNWKAPPGEAAAKTVLSMVRLALPEACQQVTFRVALDDGNLQVADVLLQP